MSYKVIKLRLTDDQVQQIESVTTGGGDFALLAEPKLEDGTLRVQVCTNEQFNILRPAILKAHKLPQWRRDG